MFQPKLFFRDLCVLAISDGRLAPEELRQLNLEAQKLNLSREVVQQELTDVIARPRLSLWVPQERHHTHSLYSALVRIAASDGDIAPQETALIERVGFYLGLSPDQVDEDLGSISSRFQKVSPKVVMSPRLNNRALLLSGIAMTSILIALSAMLVL